MPDPVVRFRVEFGPQSAVGPGKIALLEQITQSGSLRSAARKLGMGYRRAWLLLDSLNTSFGEQVATSRSGSGRGGGTTLTHLGLELVRVHRALDIELHARAARRFRPLMAQVRKTKNTRVSASIRRRSLSKR